MGSRKIDENLKNIHLIKAMQSPEGLEDSPLQNKIEFGGIKKGRTEDVQEMIF